MANEDVEMNAVSTGNQLGITSIFNQYADSRGMIAVGKFEDIVEAHRTSLTETTIRRLLDYADTNHDGFISKAELLKLERENPATVARNAGVNVEEITVFKRGVKAVGRFVLTNKDDERKYYEHYSCCPPPIFMILISIAELVVYIYYGATYNEWLSYAPELISSPLIFDPGRRYEVWRFLTYMLLHAGVEHFLFNIIIQLLLGIPLEMVHGGLSVGSIYLAGVIGGSLASSIFDPYIPLVGASGGVYALFTAQLANVILNGDVMHKLGSLVRTVFVVLILCGDFGYSIYRRFQSDNSNVSFVAHVAGAIAGLTVGLMVLHNFKKSLRDKIVFWIAVGVYIAFMLFGVFWIFCLFFIFLFYLFGVFWNAFWPYYENDYS